MSDLFLYYLHKFNYNKIKKRNMKQLNVLACSVLQFILVIVTFIIVILIFYNTRKDTQPNERN